MDTAPRTHWKAIRVEGETASDRTKRLAALYRFQNGEAPADLGFVDEAQRVVRPGDVDWSGFPIIHALEAVAHEELRRLRSLFVA